MRQPGRLKNAYLKLLASDSQRGTELAKLLEKKSREVDHTWNAGELSDDIPDATGNHADDAIARSEFKSNTKRSRFVVCSFAAILQPRDKTPNSR